MILIALISLILKLVVVALLFVALGYVAFVIQHEIWRRETKLTNVPRFGNVILSGARALMAGSPQIWRDYVYVSCVLLCCQTRNSELTDIAC
jgi:hypothetical protein